MSVLFGHPSGNPNSHHAALSHFESGQLEAFCVSWFPTQREIRLLKRLPGLGNLSRRVERRYFAPLSPAPKIEGRLSEWNRMARRVLFDRWISSEALAYEANDWLMKTMARECQRATVTAVHSFEDCSLQQFKIAKRLGKACIYDMPIGYYPAWEEIQRRLAAEFEEWLPDGGLPETPYVRPEQKKSEMELADLVLGPSSFVGRTVEAFIYAGQASIRKGTPLLLKAWDRAGLKDAELLVVGSWQMANSARRKLGANVKYLQPCSAEQLRKHYQSADVFVFPSYFEGFGLVLLEAMACGLPVLASECTAAPDFLTPDCGSIAPAGDLDAWTEALRLASINRERLPLMKEAARQVAVENTWKRYRRAVSNAVDQLLS